MQYSALITKGKIVCKGVVYAQRKISVPLDTEGQNWDVSERTDIGSEAAIRDPSKPFKIELYGHREVDSAWSGDFDICCEGFRVVSEVQKSIK